MGTKNPNLPTTRFGPNAYVPPGYMATSGAPVPIPTTAPAGPGGGPIYGGTTSFNAPGAAPPPVSYTHLTLPTNREV